MLLARFEKAERYYHVYEQPTLFADVVDLVCVWGTFDSNRDGQKIVICKDTNDLEIQLDKITRRRRSRKYKEY